jgi:hypothetical protein
VHLAGRAPGANLSHEVRPTATCASSGLSAELRGHVFETSHPFLFFDYFRIPYRQKAAAPGEWLGQLRTRERTLLWPVFETDIQATEPPGALPSATYSLGTIPVHCRLLDDAMTARARAVAGGTWRKSTPVQDARGVTVASVWRDEHGNVVLPFDPAEAIRGYWSERYQQPAAASARGRAKRIARTAYYRVRPVLPRRTQLQMRRLFSRVQARAAFPRWPVETGLHDLYDWLFDVTADLAGAPVPWLAPWPGGRSWAMVLTHDVETSVGYQRLGVLRDIELAAGVRSSWNFVPGRYHVADELVRSLLETGFEVGVHGLYHDGRDLESLERLTERLPGMRSAADRWQASGFRSPATQRVWEYMPRLGFDYDSSYPDSDPFEPQAGGCCSWLPFFNGNLVELPITLPQDHTLFAILDHTDDTAWLQKSEHIRRRGGMGLLITHPDYTLDRRVVAAYRRFLDHVRDEPGVWCALPREVSAWWRRRAASHIVPAVDGWRVMGPAATEATIEFASPA